MYQAVVFDLDGTLLNSESTILHARGKMLREIGVNVTHERLKQTFGMPEIETLHALGVPEKDIACALARYAQLYKTFLDEVTVYPGIEELLPLLPRKGLVTSETADEMQMNFYNKGLEPYFAEIVCFDDTQNHKPHPEPLQLCLKKLNCPPENALYIGDSLFDMHCAAACGVDFGLAYWGANPKQEFASAKYIFKQPNDVLKAVTYA